MARQLQGYGHQPVAYGPSPMYGMPGTYLAPSTGIRTFLLIMLALSTVFTGLLTLFGLIGESSPTNESGTTGVVLFIAFLVMTIRLHQALGFPDPPDEEIDRLLADFREGRRELPDFRVRLG